MAGGDVIHHNNNRKSYPVQDAIIFQKRQSCLLQSSGTLILTVAVRNDVTDHPISASIAHKKPQTNSPVPRLQKMTVELEKGRDHGEYTLFSVDTTIPGGLSSESTIDITGGGYAEAFRRVDEIGQKCQPFEGSDKYSSVKPPASSIISKSATGSGPVTSITTSGTVMSGSGSGTVTPASPSETATSERDSGTVTSVSLIEPDTSDASSQRLFV